MIYTVLQIIIILTVSILASIQDIRRGKVSDFLLWGGTLLMIVCHVIFIGVEAWTYLVGGIFASLIFILARALTKEKLGLADVYFAGFAGVSLDWQCVWIFILASCLLAGIFYLVRFLWKKNNSAKIPFVPFLSISLVITYIILVYYIAFHYNIKT